MMSITSDIDESARIFMQQVQEVNPHIQADLIERTFRFAYTAHKGQRRKSGEPYLAHPVAVALILAEQKLDSTTIAAGLLHDVLEDTEITREQMQKEFGDEIVLLVDGVTKIQQFQMKNRQERLAET